MRPDPKPPHRRTPQFLAALALTMLASALVVGTARAQLGFTEFALTDSSFTTGLDTDFWIASAAPADVDGDGDLDVLVCGYFVDYVQATVVDRLTLYRNDGPAGPATWALAAVAIDATGLYFSAGDIAWGDYDGDGDPDVAVAGRFATTLFRNDAGTLLRTSTVLPGYEEAPDFLTMDQRSLSWADFDNDGDLDLMLPCVWNEAAFSFAPAVLLRNDGPGTGDAWTFTDSGQPFPQRQNVATAWADMDADGDLDLMFGNMGQYEPPSLDLYRNDSGLLVRADSALAEIVHGTADWADADGDGDFDLVVAGNLMKPDGTGETVVRLLRRDPANWTPIDIVREFQSVNEPWLDFEGVTWADYDSDGDVDLLVTGQWLGSGEIIGRAEVYANQGGTFALAGAPLPGPNFGNTGGAFTWFDIDGDGDLDYFVAGGYYVPNGNGLIEARVQLFRNDAIASNSAPSAVAGLHANAAGSQVTLSWNDASDTSTPTASLTYELAVARVTPAGAPSAVFGSPIAVPALPQPGNVSHNTAWTIRGLAPGSYQWSVRAVDNSFSGGTASSGAFAIGTAHVDEIGPLRMALAPVAPNPFVREARVTLSLDRAQRVTIGAYDVLGRRVATLHEGMLRAGPHAFTLSGVGLESGLYFVRADGETESAIRRVTLLR